MANAKKKTLQCNVKEHLQGPEVNQHANKLCNTTAELHL